MGEALGPTCPRWSWWLRPTPGLILTVRLLGRVPSVAEKQEPVLELLEQAGRLPGGLVCDREGTAELLVPIASALGIGLYVGPTLAVDLIKDDLLATILH